MLHVRSIFPDQDRVEASALELVPTNPQGEAVCCLFERYLQGRPSSFRDQLSFLKKGDFELDWSSIEGGVALASIFQAREPASMCVLVSGSDPEADAMMLEAFRENVLNAVLGRSFDEALAAQERPLLVQIIFSETPEWLPALQLLSVCLASVYFRSLDKICGARV